MPADLTAIRRGLAANLAVLKEADGFTALQLKPIGQISPFLIENPSPPALLVTGVEPDGFEMTTFGDDIAATFLIEACLGTIADRTSQRMLDALMAPSGPTSLIEAVQADRRLTSRYGDDGRVTTNQDPAASAVAFSGYRGQAKTRLGQAEVLLATWAVQVVT